MKKKNLFNFLITLLFFFSLFSMSLAAEKYPTREIQIVTINAPGGTIDLALRLMKDLLAKNLGVPVIVNNKPGAAGATGTNYVVQSKPDGYTIGCIASAHVVILPVTNPTIPYKYSDLDPICKYAFDTGIAFCKADAPWKTLENLVEDAKRRPGQITYGATANSISSLSMETFLKAAGIKMLFVPLPGPQDTTIRILGGNLDMGFSGVSVLSDQLKTGSVRALFVTSRERVSSFPQIPTLKEKGYPDPVIDLYFGFFVPLGVPKSIKATLEKALENTLKDPALKKKLEEVPLSLDYLPFEAFAKELDEDYKLMNKLTKIDAPQK